MSTDVMAVGSVNGDGYHVVRAPHHPLATAQGKLLVHRATLYDAIGDGPHSCHWCTRAITWQGPASTRINVDHLDHDRLNNTRANLVASCLDCNTKRRAQPWMPVEQCRRAGHPYTAENTITRKDGYRICRACRREQAPVHAERNRERARDWYYANRARVLARRRECRSA